jgi:hypothetical protein
MSCTVCHKRPPRRACPALGHGICPVCCGTKRQVEIRCPESCAYLTAARTHPAASVRRQQDQDLALLTPALGGLSEARQQLLLFSLTLFDRFSGAGLEAATDADVASAAASLAATYETESRGVIYEHRADSVAAQRIATGIRGVFDQLGRDRPSGFAADAAVVLRQLEDRVRSVQHLQPSDPRAFLALANRVSKRLGSPETAAGETERGAPGDGSAPSPIILP